MARCNDKIVLGSATHNLTPEASSTRRPNKYVFFPLRPLLCDGGSRIKLLKR